MNTIKTISIKLNGTEYAYNKDVSDVLALLNKGDEPKEAPENVEEGTGVSTADIEINKGRNAYLKQVLESLKKVKSLNINDIYLLATYKEDLMATLASEENDITLNTKGIKLVSEILGWYPVWIGLTPIALLVEEADEVQISALITHASDSSAEEVKVGKYRVVGGMAFNLGSRIYLTGLKNNEVFTEMQAVGPNGEEELRAGINSKNQRSVGIGLNGEIAFRTGTLVNPTINLGFFVPFEEEISPYLALGPGFTISNAKVKISFGGGLAYGKVNSIAERYVDTDVSGVTDITGLTEKIWDSSWYLSVGFSYRFNEGN